MIPIYSIKEDNHEMLDEVILIYAISEIIAFSFEFPNRQYFRGLDADLCFIFCFLSANPISKCLYLLLLCSYSFERWDSKKHPFPGLIFNSSVRHPSKWLNYFLLLGLAYQKHFSVPARKYFSRRVLEKWRRNGKDGLPSIASWPNWRLEWKDHEIIFKAKKGCLVHSLLMMALARSPWMCA